MFIASSFGLMAQNYSTGVVNLSNGSVQLDVDASGVTMTLVGFDDGYLGLGFDTTSMTPGKDVTIFDGIDLTDRTFNGVGSEPILDTSQDWSLVSAISTGGQVTVIATRALDTGEANDYVFSLSPITMNLVFSYGPIDTNPLPFETSNGGSPVYHTRGRGSVSIDFTLSTDDFNVGLDFSLSPNPAKDKFVVSLPNTVENAKLEVFNVLGKRVLAKEISDIDSSVNVSNWNSGIYLVRVSNGETSQTKRLVKQ